VRVGPHEIVLDLAVRVVYLLALAEGFDPLLPAVAVELVTDRVVRGPIGRLAAERHLAGLI